MIVVTQDFWMTFNAKALIECLKLNRTCPWRRSALTVLIPHLVYLDIL